MTTVINFQTFKGSDGNWRARVEGHTIGPYMTQDAACIGADMYITRVYGKTVERKLCGN